MPAITRKAKGVVFRHGPLRRIIPRMAEIRTTTTGRVPIDTVRPHPKNARQGDVGAICASIERFGFLGSILARQSDGAILAGAHRWQAAKALGLTEIPVSWIECDEAEALAIILADNRSHDLGSYDDARLAALLSETLDGDPEALEAAGYDGDDLAEMLALAARPLDLDGLRNTCPKCGGSGLVHE